MNKRHTPPDRQKMPLWKYLGRALPVILLVSLLTLALDHYGWLKSFETGALDRFLILQERVPASHVVIVEIDNDDYEQLFHETSPLDPETLRDLIDAIAQNQPKLIAIDIDTSAKVFKGFKTNPKWPPIVWARGAHQSDEEKQGPSGQQKDEDIFVPEKVLGEEQPPANSSAGIALLPLDSDSQIRHFRREYPLSNAGDPSASVLRADSFHWAVVRKYCELVQNEKRCGKLFDPHAEKPDKELFLNLAIDPYAFETSIRSSKVLAEATPENVAGSAPVFLSLKDRIVILGGNYDAARDSYDTPVGTKHGVELAAIAVESELSGFGIRHVNHYVLFALEVLAGVLMAVLNYLFPRGWKRLIALAAIPTIALLGSYIAFSSLALWANFIPTLIGVQLHFLYDKLAEAKHLEKEVRTLKEQLKLSEQTAPDEPPQAPDSAGDEETDTNPETTESVTTEVVTTESEKAEVVNMPEPVDPTPK